MNLSIIIPVYNESATIEEIVGRVSGTRVKGVKKEIIIVDDCSTDGTKKKIKKLAKKNKSLKTFFHKKNKGKGAAIRTGLKKARGDYVLIQDADLEYDPKDYEVLLKPIMDGRTTVVYGSRFLGSRRNMFFWHMLANKMLSLTTNILYNTTLSDMEVGYKVFPKKLLNSLHLRENGFGFEPEVTAKILKRGIRIFEVPISYFGREFEEGKKITWKDGVRAFFVLFKYRLVG